MASLTGAALKFGPTNIAAADVFVLRHRFKVLGIEATFDAAQVVDLVPLGDGPYVELVREDVHVSHASFDADLSIP